MTSNFRARLGELVFEYRIESGSNRRSNWDQIAEQCVSVEQRVSQFRVVSSLDRFRMIIVGQSWHDINQVWFAPPPRFHNILAVRFNWTSATSKSVGDTLSATPEERERHVFNVDRRFE